MYLHNARDLERSNNLKNKTSAKYKQRKRKKL